MNDFFKDQRVLVTGHTGFKGTWLTKMLVNGGAEVLGYSLGCPTKPSLYALADVEGRITHVEGDIRDYAHLQETFSNFRPEVVFHLAAQPIVRESYADPRNTYGTNVMGTVNMLEVIRTTDSVKSAVIVTTDKVYRNDESGRKFREEDVLDGFDPYSNSKSCAELATACYKRSFPSMPPVSTARAGNVIGGGDFAKDRIIPDCVRAAIQGEPIFVRNPHSVRPYQHVLEPLAAYLLLAEKQAGNPILAGSYNIGPDDDGCITTGELVRLFCEEWGGGASWIDRSGKDAPHEAGFLRLDTSLAREVLGWKPMWDIRSTVEKTVSFYRLLLSGGSVAMEMDEEIRSYFQRER
jgi:CDP-glucose 4,6-dehydratase